MSSLLVPIVGVGLVLWALLFFGGRLINTSLKHSTGANVGNARSRFFRDLKPLEDLVVEFVAHTPEFAQILRLLARETEPLSFAQIVHELRITGKGSSPADSIASLTGVALIILNLVGFVRLQRGGFVATVIGREVKSRMLPGSTAALTGAGRPVPRASCHFKLLRHRPRVHQK